MAWFKSTAVSGNTSRRVMCAMCNAMHCVQGTRWRFAQKLQRYDCQNGGDAAGACNRLLNHASPARKCATETISQKGVASILAGDNRAVRTCPLLELLRLAPASWQVGNLPHD